MVDFELIKGRIQKHSLSSIVSTTLEILNEIQRADDKRFPIWNMFALLKWTYLHTSDSPLRTPIQFYEYDQLLELIRQFEVKYDGLNFTSHKAVSQSFRIIAYQQFDYQDSFYNSIIDRQTILFTILKTKIDLEKEFRSFTGIGLKDFFNYFYFTYIYINLDSLASGFTYDGTLHTDFVGYFTKQFSAPELKKFLALLTITKSIEFANLQKLNNERLQLYETNFFVTKPFIFFKDQYRLPHRSILIQSIKHFVYTFMKAAMPNTFPDDFGKRLEQYISLGLRENNLRYVTENTLKKQFQLKQVADYMIDDDILIECKASELHPRSGVLRLPNILTKELNSSIIKAYCQLLSTANMINAKKEWFGIIITYREMYLGFGSDAWDEFMKSPVEKFVIETDFNINVLPPQNLFFVTIEYWDYMMQIIKEGKGSLKEMLIKGKELNSSTNPAEKIFLIEQVLKKHFQIHSLDLSYLKEAHKTINITPEDSL